MFDLDQFIADCRAALAADKSHKNVREIVARAVSDPTAIPKGSGDHSRRSAPRNQPQLQPLQMLRYAYSERPRQHTPRPHRRAGSLEGPESLDARYYPRAQIAQSAGRVSAPTRRGSLTTGQDLSRRRFTRASWPNDPRPPAVTQASPLARYLAPGLCQVDPRLCVGRVRRNLSYSR
jgi:hypothetical protein